MHGHMTFSAGVQAQTVPDLLHYTSTYVLLGTTTPTSSYSSFRDLSLFLMYSLWYNYRDSSRSPHYTPYNKKTIPKMTTPTQLNYSVGALLSPTQYRTNRVSMKCSWRIPGGRRRSNSSIASDTVNPRRSIKYETIKNPVRLNP